MNTQETNQAQPLPEVQPIPVAAVATQPTAAPVTRRVSPGLALVLSFFPGLGHLYLGMYRRAFAVFGAFAAATWLADKSDLGILIPFIVLFAVIDAYRHANFINSGVPVEVEMPTVGKREPRKAMLGWGVFLAVLGCFILYNNFYPIDFDFMREWWPMLLVLAGVWLVGSYYWDRRKRENLELQSEAM